MCLLLLCCFIVIILQEHFYMINHIFLFCLLVRDAIFQKFINSCNFFFHQVKNWAALQIKQFTALQFQHKSKGTFNENNVYAKSKLGIT